MPGETENREKKSATTALLREQVSNPKREGGKVENVNPVVALATLQKVD